MKINELKAELARKEMTIDQLAELTGIKRSRIYRRFSHADEFTLSEIYNIAKVLSLDSKRVMEIFFDEKVS